MMGEQAKSGARVQATTAPERELLYQMKRIRRVEEEIAARYHEGKMRCPTHLSIGQEAVAAGVGAALRRSDLAVSSHRAHAHYLAKGGDMKAMIAEIYGKATGCSRGHGGSMHLIDLLVGFEGSTAIVSNSIPVGVGLALGVQLRGADALSCVFLGDGAIEEGVFYESANFAAVRKLPVLFVCENNFYSVYSPLEVRQPRGRQIFEMVRAIGIPSEAGDGNDVLQVYRMAVDAAVAVRAGGGPRFLEFTTYRWREHCGPNFDNDIGYRSEDEFLDWKMRDPLPAFEAELVVRGVMTREEVSVMNEGVDAEVAAAFEFAEHSSFPDPNDLSSRVYK